MGSEMCIRDRCETCGKEISTNLYRGEPSGYRQGDTAPQGCPNCGDLNPHREILTEEMKKLLGELHYVRPYGVKGLDGILSELDSPIEEPLPKKNFGGWIGNKLSSSSSS